MDRDGQIYVPTDRLRQVYSHRFTDRETDRQTNKQTSTDKCKERQPDGQMGRCIDRQPTYRQRCIDRWTDSKVFVQTDRSGIDRQTHL